MANSLLINLFPLRPARPSGPTGRPVAHYAETLSRPGTWRRIGEGWEGGRGGERARDVGGVGGAASLEIEKLSALAALCRDHPGHPRPGGGPHLPFVTSSLRCVACQPEGLNGWKPRFVRSCCLTGSPAEPATGVGPGGGPRAQLRVRDSDSGHGPAPVEELD
jgi:hypothetical protein